MSSRYSDGRRRGIFNCPTGVGRVSRAGGRAAAAGMLAMHPLANRARSSFPARVHGRVLTGFAVRANSPGVATALLAVRAGPGREGRCGSAFWRLRRVRRRRVWRRIPWRRRPRRRRRPWEGEAEPLFQGAQAGDEFVAGQDRGGGNGEVLFGAVLLDQFDVAAQGHEARRRCPCRGQTGR